MTLPKSSTIDVVADAEDEPHVVVDEEHRGAASRRSGAGASPRRLALGGVEPCGRLVEAERLGSRRARAPRRPACAGPGSVDSGGPSARSSMPRRASAAPTAGSTSRSAAGELADRPESEGRPAVTARFSATVELVEQVGGLPGPRKPRAGALVRRHAGQVAAVQLDGSARARETGDRVDERRLAGAVGTDQAHELPALDLEVDIDQRAHAAVVDADGRRCAGRLVTASSAAPRPSGSRRGQAASSGARGRA